MPATEHEISHTGNRTAISLITDITLILLSTAFVIARLYARKFITKSLGLDDLAAFISLVRYARDTLFGRLFTPFTTGHSINVYIARTRA